MSIRSATTISLVVSTSFLFLTILAQSPTPSDAQRNSCHAQCDPIPTWTRFEECLRICYSSSQTRSTLGDTSTAAIVSEITLLAVTKKYPDRPHNTVVVWNVQIERYMKYLRATVYWEAADDSIREGFYLSFLPVDKRCEDLFPGYYTHNIPKEATSWEIPAHLPGLQPLTIDYGCVYTVELRSKPYPYGDSKYTLMEKFEVPSCVDGYCSCKNQTKLPPPADVELEYYTDPETKFDKARVKWRYNISSDDDVHERKSKRVQFRIMLADLFRKPTVAPWKKLFKWRPWNSTVLANKDEFEYATDLPSVKESFEYKLQIFAMNEHMCKSEPVEKEFIFSSPTSTSTSSASTEPTDESTSADVENASRRTVTAVVNETSLVSFSDIDPDNGTGIDKSIIDLAEKKINDTAPIDSTPYEKTTLTISVETIKSAYSRDEYFLMAFLPIIVVLCLIITGFAACKFYAARRQKLLKKQQYFERLVQFPWTLLTHASTSPSMETNILYTEKEIIDARERGLADEYEISYERLSMGRVIGQGAFGLVYLGTAMAINNLPGLAQVAIKQLKANADERERCEFLEEIAIMKKVGHHANIVAMYGCCTLQYPHCMVMEYVPYGDLLRYLRNLRKEFEKQIEEYRISLERDYIMQLNTHPLMTHAEINAAVRSIIGANTDLAGPIILGNSLSRNSGFYCDNEDNESVYEEGDYPIPFADADQEIGPVRRLVPAPPTHHDLNQQLTYTLDNAELQSFAYQVACGMNHLEQLNITHRDLAARNILVGHGKTLKISDFGLSRMGIYVKTTSGRIPLRWLSIEAMRDHTYSTKSDVWAYGTVLWEICTLGGFPYPTVADKDLLRYLEKGSRLEKPASCSDSVYRLMLQCWAHSPTLRPSFSHVKQTLNEMNKHSSPYVEFSPNAAAVDLLPVLPPQEYCKISPLAGIQSPQPPVVKSPVSISILAIDNDSYVNP